VAGAGASAGGLEALTRMLGEANPESPVAWVVVQHLAPDHKSLFPEILARRTALRVKAAEDGDVLMPGTVYVIPPTTYLRVEGDHLALEHHRRERDSVADSIDVLFRSLAAAMSSRCAAVVLSGSGSDGTSGAEAVRASGGLVVVQEPSTATFASMPNSVLRAGIAQHTVAPEEIASRVEAFAKEVASEAPPVMDIRPVLDILRAERGLDFSKYKRPTLLRRVSRRMEMTHSATIGDYVDFLLEDSDELDIVAEDFLIGVTRFFRDEDAFSALRVYLLDGISKSTRSSIRVWVAGCSTGQEAYSIAMMLHSLMLENSSTRTFKVFATDVSEQALTVASAGAYQEKNMDGMPEHLRNRYFREDDDGYYRVRPFLRETILFSRHDVTVDPPFSGLDLVTCRNMLIYLKAGVQEDVIQRFSFALHTGGLLFLGPSESPDMLRWECLDQRWRIYRSLQRSVRVVGPSKLPTRDVRLSTSRGVRQLQSLQSIGVGDYVPPHLVVSRGLQILFKQGKLDRLLRVPDGPATTDLRRMVSRQLGVLFQEAEQRVLEDYAESAKGDIRYVDVMELVGDREIRPAGDRHALSEPRRHRGGVLLRRSGGARSSGRASGGPAGPHRAGSNRYARAPARADRAQPAVLH